MKFGCLKSKYDPRTLRFADYAENLAAPPKTASVFDTVCAKLKLNMAQLTSKLPMDGNDEIGDCTIAALAHAVTLYAGMIGTVTVPAEADVLQRYWRLTGGVGNDTGLDPMTVLKDWKKNAMSGEADLAFVSINPKNHTHVKQAIELFGGVYTGFTVQENCIDDFNAGKPWSPGTLTEDGHAVYAASYSSTLVRVCTWGATQLGEWTWWDECVTEAYAILPTAAKYPGFAKGFNFAQLKADLAVVQA